MNVQEIINKKLEDLKEAEINNIEQAISDLIDSLLYNESKIMEIQSENDRIKERIALFTEPKLREVIL